LVRLVLESHTGRALVPIPKRSAAPRATSTLSWWIVSQKVLDLKRPIREADLFLHRGEPTFRANSGREQLQQILEAIP
jgi:hypothetical protein